jgi:hypothetical protein
MPALSLVTKLKLRHSITSVEYRVSLKYSAVFLGGICRNVRISEPLSGPGSKQFKEEES